MIDITTQLVTQCSKALGAWESSTPAMHLGCGYLQMVILAHFEAQDCKKQPAEPVSTLCCEVQEECVLTVL